MKMKAFLNHLRIQFIMDLREKGTLLTIYIIPLVFYAVMGAVFSSINPEMKRTLAASMAIFAVTMGAVLGMHAPLVKMRETGVLRAYDVSGIPGWAVLLVSAVSAFAHLLVVAVVIYATAPIFFGAALPVNALAWFAILAILLFASISVGLLLGVTAKNQASATMLSQAVFLPSLLLGGLMFPASLLPTVLMWVGRIYPATNAMQAYTSWAYNIPGDIHPAISLAVVAAAGAIVLALAVWRFNRLRKQI
jgi:ABC-2 type transport system permease protein